MVLSSPAGTTDSATTVESRGVAVRGLVNLRDVGGCRSARNGRVRTRRLFRSDAPLALTPQAIRALREHGVHTVIDLRDDDEAIASPTRLDAAGFTVLRIPIFYGSATSFVARRIPLAELYLHMVDECGPAIARAVRAIADAGDHGVLVHCSAGKDRTGVVVAFALLAAGVSRTDVVADYSASEERLRGPWLERTRATLQTHHDTDLSDALELIGGSPAWVLEATLDHVEHTHGSVGSYLAAHGTAAADLALLRRCLLTTVT